MGLLYTCSDWIRRGTTEKLIMQYLSMRTLERRVQGTHTQRTAIIAKLAVYFRGTSLINPSAKYVVVEEAACVCYLCEHVTVTHELFKYFSVELSENIVCFSISQSPLSSPEKLPAAYKVLCPSAHVQKSNWHSRIFPALAKQSDFWAFFELLLF